jgi:hypothetical protein
VAGTFHEKIKTQDFTVFVDGSKDKGRFSVFGGKLQFTHLPNGDFNRRKTKTLKPEVRLVILRAIREIRDAGPDTRLNFLVSAWDFNEKKVVKDLTVTLIKDEKRCYRIAFDLGDGKYEYRFGRVNIAVGSEPMSDVDQSALSLQVLEDYLQNTVPVECALTNTKFDRNRAQGGGYDNRQSAPREPSPSSHESKSTSDGNSRPKEWEDELFSEG